MGIADRVRRRSGTSTPNDGIDEIAWALVVAMVRRTHDSDAEAHREYFEKLEITDESIESIRMMELYLRLLLGIQVRRQLPRDPSGAEMRALAVDLASRAAHLVNPEPALHFAVIRQVLGFAVVPSEVSAFSMDFVACADLGVLLEDVDRDLAEMRPIVARYCEQNAAALQDLG